MDSKILHDWEMELDSDCDTPSSSDTGNCDTPSSSEWNTSSFSEDNSDMDFDSDFFERPRKRRKTDNQPKNQTADDQMSCIESFSIRSLLFFAILAPLVLAAALWPSPSSNWPAILTVNTATVLSTTTATVVSTTTATVVSTTTATVVSTTTATVVSTVVSTTTATVVSTVVSTTTATATPTPTSVTPRHIVPEGRSLPDGVPRSLGLWKQMARKIYYSDCLQGCEAQGANCDFWNPGKWEKACAQTDSYSYGDIDCSAANLLEAAGGRRGNEVPIPDGCLHGFAVKLQGWRVDDVERKQREGK